jgi:hypothetical protein
MILQTIFSPAPATEKIGTEMSTDTRAVNFRFNKT